MEKNKFDDKGHRHGYWEFEATFDNINGMQNARCNYINGRLDGYFELKNKDGVITCKGNIKNDMKIGLWEHKRIVPDDNLKPYYVDVQILHV